MKVDDPDGRTWKVRRRITPWKRYFAGTFDNLDAAPAHEWNRGKLATMQAGTSGGGDSSHFIALVKMPFLALLLPITVLVRVLFGRPWTVEITLDAHLWREERAGRWIASGRRVEEVAEGIRAGDVPARTTPEYR